ncbi:MAG: TonB family protein [Novosphingobium sp.]
MSPSLASPAYLTQRYRAGGSRGPAAGAALAAELLLATVLIYGLAGPVVGLPQPPASLVSMRLDNPPKPEEHHLKASNPAQNGRAAPPSLKAEAASVKIPQQVIVPPKPLPAAPVPAQSMGLKPGAAAVLGPGTGLAGQGTGTGSGNGGNGTGSGSGAGEGGGSDAEWTGGKIKNSDYPKAVREAHISGTTETVVSVGANGRPTACRVTRTSGSRELDTTTCTLIMKRFKFRPARNAGGQAIDSRIEYEQEWDAPPPPPEE